VIVTAAAPVPVPGGAGGTWVGLAPDGVINVSPTCGREAADVQFVITQTGSTIAGTLTARIREASPVLTEPCFTGTVGSIRTGSLTGTVNGNYAKNESVPPGSLAYESYWVTVGLNYKVSRILNTTLSYTNSQYKQHFSGLSARFDRNMVMLGSVVEVRDRGRTVGGLQ